VNSQGVFEKEELFNIIESILSNDSQAAILINLQVANNEVGTCYDFSFLPELWEKWGPKVQLHRPKQKGGQHPYTEQKIWIALDAVQALGKLSENYLRRIIHFSDYCVLSSHKIGGPTGMGVLWVRPKSPFFSLITGGSQEKKRRAGTHNILAIHGFLQALKDWQVHGDRYRNQMSEQRNRIARVLQNIPRVHIHSQALSSLAPLINTINFHAEDYDDDSLLIGLDLVGICVSSGSACHSGSVKASPVLLAMGFDENIARSSVRISLSAEQRMGNQYRSS
jgi:cysteine desulfurase